MDDLIQQSQVLPSQSQWPNSQSQLPASELTEPISEVPTQSQDSQQTEEQKPWGMLAYVSSKLKHKPNIGKWSDFDFLYQWIILYVFVSCK